MKQSHKSPAHDAEAMEPQCYIPTRPPAIVCVLAAVFDFIHRCRVRMANWLSGGMIRRQNADITRMNAELKYCYLVEQNLRMELFTRTGQLAYVRGERDGLSAQLKVINADIAKVQLSNEDPASRGRVGWQVSAWIPESILDSVRRGNPELNVFIRTVTDTLVNNAITRIFKRNPAGHCTALVFGEKGKMDGWYEGDPSQLGITYNSQGDEAIRRIVGRDLAEGAAVNSARLLSDLPPANGAS